MCKQNRLTVIQSSNHFVTCKQCKFTYLPMTARAEKQCPKCEPNEASIKFVDPDVTYLLEEMRQDESVNNDSLHDNFYSL